MQLAEKMSIPVGEDFNSPWVSRYEVRMLRDGGQPSFAVCDLLRGGHRIAVFESNHEAKVECAILQLAHLRELRLVKLAKVAVTAAQ